MITFMFLFSVFFCCLCYVNLDPMKSSFFLIFSLLSSVPLISFGGFVWYSYFICLLFLSGIFVILVYFSSLSKINFLGGKGVLLCLVITLMIFSPNLFLNNPTLNINVFYYLIYFYQIMFIIFTLLLFMNFSSYFLNFSGALRKI